MTRSPAREAPAACSPTACPGTRKAACRLEAGGRNPWFWIDIPIGDLYAIANARTDCAAGPSPALSRRLLDRLRARHRGR